MEQVKTKSYRVLATLLFSFLILIGGIYSVAAKADTVQSTPLAGQQLSYFIGYHSAPGYVYYGPRYHHRKFYWTGWRNVGHGCRKNCLIDSRSGRIIRCNRVCR